MVSAQTKRAAKRKNEQLTNFTDLGLAAPILKALRAEGYSEPTPIQAKAIPIVLAGRDLLGIAQTGTGKTAAFALPIIHRLAANRHKASPKGCRVLVLTPTRELATQIAESFRTYGRHLDLTVAVVFGGVGHVPQIQALARGVDVLVATPGRLLDHLGETQHPPGGNRNLRPRRGRSDAGSGLPAADPPHRRPPLENRQNLFFSATMPREIGKLAEELLRDPVRIAVTPVATTVDSVEQRVLHVENKNKRSLLVELFADADMSRTLVFTRTKRGADKVAGISGGRYRRRRNPRQQEPVAARARAGGLPRLAGSRAGGDRHCRARHRHRSGDARRELRAAGRPGKLCPPHRAYGARRRAAASPSRFATPRSAASCATSSV